MRLMPPSPIRATSRYRSAKTSPTATECWPAPSPGGTGSLLKRSSSSKSMVTSSPVTAASAADGWDGGVAAGFGAGAGTAAGGTSAGLRLDVDAGDGVGIVGSTGIGEVVPVLA